MAARFVQANTNGRLHPATEPSVSPLDRGFLYGDAVYEVWRTYGRALFAWKEHWSRLLASARALHLELPFGPERIWEEIARTASVFRAADGRTDELYVRLQISRGCGPIGLDTALADEPSFVILVQPCPELPAEKLRSGLRLSLATSLRRNSRDTLDPAWKTGNYLNNLLCLREARARGADEVVMLNLQGAVTEAAVSNIAFVRGGELVTPPLGAGILGGITRGFVLSRIAIAAGLRAKEAEVRPEEFAAIDECMLLSTTRDVVPVAAIDGAAFKVGPATATARLKAAFAEYAAGYARAHPELRV